jgi:glycosyltransferase involved in cell wall biosynthesis
MSAAKKKGVTSTSFSVIPNGYNQDVFHALNRAKNTKKIIGFVGNLIPIKRAEKLPEIIKLIIEKDKSVHAIIIGDGHLMTSMEADCEQFKDHVSFTGRLPANEVAHFMRTMDVLMLPSRSESFGCVIKEAQACGASVIGSDAGGIPEVIGTGGLVINEGPQFEHRFAEGVVQLLNHPIQATILKKESESFRWEHTMQLEEAIYHGVINSKR